MIAAFGQKGYVTDVISVTTKVFYLPSSEGAFYNTRNSRDEAEICSEADSEKFFLRDNMVTNVRNVSEFLGLIFGKLYGIVFETPLSRLYEELTTLKIRTSLGTSQPFAAVMPEDQLNQILPSGYVGNGVADDSKMLRSLYDILYRGDQDQKLVIIHDFMTHAPYNMDENGAPTGHGNSIKPMDYYPQHVFSAKVLVGMVDMILAADPYAVIVIQSDHGEGAASEEEIKSAFGEDADAPELWNGTMSAIRVPEKYRTGEEHYATETPLNISRYLVNSFVGQNYEYLPSN